MSECKSARGPCILITGILSRSASVMESASTFFRRSRCQGDFSFATRMRERRRCCRSSLIRSAGHFTRLIFSGIRARRSEMCWRRNSSYRDVSSLDPELVGTSSVVIKAQCNYGAFSALESSLMRPHTFDDCRGNLSPELLLVYRW